MKRALIVLTLVSLALMLVLADEHRTVRWLQLKNNAFSDLTQFDAQRVRSLLRGTRRFC